MSKAPILSVRGLTRTYDTAQGGLTVLRGVDLDVYPGELVGLIGPSGSGKSSLLHAAGLLEKPNAPAPACVWDGSASSINSTICWPSSMPATTWPCRCGSPAWARTRPANGPKSP